MLLFLQLISFQNPIAIDDTIWDDYHTLNVLEFDNILPSPENLSAKGDIESSIRATFGVMETSKENGQLVFCCRTYEGPYVHSIHDVKYVVERMFGPDIVKQLQALGLEHFAIRF